MADPGYAIEGPGSSPGSDPPPGSDFVHLFALELQKAAAY